MSSAELVPLEHFQEYRVELKGLKPVVLGWRSSGEWADITHLRINFSNLNFLGEDSQEFLDSDHRLKVQGVILRIMFFIECFELKYDGSLIWRYFEEDDFGFPVGLLINYENNSLSLLYKNERVKPLNIRAFNFAAGRKVRKLTRVMDLCANPKTTDSLNSEFKTDEEKLKEPEEIDGKKDKIPMWSSEEDDSKATSVVHDKKNNIVTIKFDDKVIICKKELGEWTRTTIRIPRELLILDKSNERISTSKYDLSAEGDNFLIDFRNKLTLGSIKHNKKTLWKRLSGRPQPLSLMYKRNKRIVFRFEDVLIACYLDNGRWTRRRFKLPPLRLCDMSFFSTVSEIEPCDYNVLLEPFNGFTYNLKPGTDFSLIAYGSSVIWKLRQDEMIPTAVTCYPEDGIIYVYYEKQFFVHIKDSSDNWSEYV
ncbi:hypothetical protein TpMuguga_03g00829 [Theileria parva strain Muguga]|uniref:Uncharacterized protein n=1 Tax=Theileria parva TaxID=5875 RepID=Q4MYL2_THEPA|nr:uncharacterized protein TpMuguga_03g00829 [Theileria parva strain Muguga]EAN30670.1 hypothetical protein TpMuguga_03g00829 [Theileria parva strain Muguga]|eukprot:XP_762953.1 hypothetical protein [Theileria parva strain Muguga]